MSNAYFQLYRDAEGTFTFNDRNNEVYDKSFLEMLKLELAKMCMLRLTEVEYTYISAIRFLSTNYTEWLKGFHFEYDKIQVSLDSEGHLHIEVTDKMYKVTLYEVPILAIVAECRNKWLGVKIDMAKVIDILDKKIDFANEHQLYFAEFGTRRRASAASHEQIVKRLKERCPIYCVGTSNVYFAMKYGMKYSGTCAHERIMFHAGIGGFKTANLDALNDWIKVYQGDLGISLIDTYTTASYLHTLTMKQAKLLDGFRQDSGDEFKIGNMIIDKLKEFRIDPTSKTIVFSNALDFEKYAEVARYFKGRIKVSAGIGTNLTCDLGIDGYKPANIVMKLSKCRYSPRDFWEYVIKISDDLGKHMGMQELFDIAVRELHLKELGVKI
jgi:nicotinate phosphoribosyltransferase